MFQEVGTARAKSLRQEPEVCWRASKKSTVALLE